MRPRASDTPLAGCLSLGLFLLVAGWVVLITLGWQAATWLTGQQMLIEEQPMPPRQWMRAAWENAALVALPVLPLAFLTRAPRLRAAYVTWAAAAGFMALAAFARALPETVTQAASLVQVAAAAVAALGWWASSRGTSALPGGQSSGLAPAVAAGTATTLPWLAFGALGSPLDTELNLAATVALAAFAGPLIGSGLWSPIRRHTTGPGRDLLFGGFAAGVALLVIGAGYGYGGSQLLLLAVLPPVGFLALAVAVLASRHIPGEERAALPVALVIGLAALGPLAFVDPDELVVFLDNEDVPAWALRSVLASAAISLGLTVLLWILRLVARPPVVAWRASALLSVAAAVAVYLGGQPGFYGERLFVILRDQADLSQVSAVPEQSERARLGFETLTRHAERTQAGLRGDLDRWGLDYQPYYLVNALEVDGGPLVRAALARRPEVDRILDSPRLRPLPEKPRPPSGDDQPPAGPDWNVAMIGADRVWEEFGVRGAGIVVGQSDSGVEGTHPALAGRYRGRGTSDDYNWFDPWNASPSPTDLSGHGTHTLGSVLGAGGIGVAPEAQWIGCVNLARNIGNPARYLDCMQFVLAPFPRGGDPFRDGDPGRGAQVTNNSWGCPPFEGCDAGSLRPAVAAMRAAGIFMVASAGNSGPRCGSLGDPIAIYPEVFTVGAVDRTGGLAGFSSRGPVAVDGSGRLKPDVVAPGVDVLSAFPGSSYEQESGTSMAGPHVAGVVALIWSAQPRLVGDVERTERILRETARPRAGYERGCSPGASPNPEFGYGTVDAYAAVRAALALR